MAIQAYKCYNNLLILTNSFTQLTEIVYKEEVSRLERPLQCDPLSFTAACKHALTNIGRVD